MVDLNQTLDRIARTRKDDPLANATVIVPSRLAALQLRRRLAIRGPFAGVRFEPLARLAELIAASTLARSQRRPLARPIADYVSTRIARESRWPLDGVRDIPGYARALRHTFRRLRRGGFHDGQELIQAGMSGDGLAEIARLYTRFREDTAAFYDDEDLMETASEVLRASLGSVLPELGRRLRCSSRALVSGFFPIPRRHPGFLRVLRGGRAGGVCGAGRTLHFGA
jgi:hypothetical protein